RHDPPECDRRQAHGGGERDGPFRVCDRPGQEGQSHDRLSHEHGPELRRGAAAARFGWIMSYSFATVRSASPISGSFTSWPWVSLISRSQRAWSPTGSTLKPTTLSLRRSNSGLSPAI